MKYADLHIHSSYSDGLQTPEEIISEAKKCGVKCISITDHDSISSQYITKQRYENLKIIPGIELSTEYKDMELHILGYFIDIDNQDLNEVVAKLNKQRLKRVENILFNLQKCNIELKMSDLESDTTSTLGRSHIANAMVNKGYFDSYKSAFKTYLVKGKPGYVKGFRLHYREALDVIVNAGGIPVLAHPGQIYKKIETDNIIKELKCFGLKGVEVYHPSHSCKDTNMFYNICKKYKLSITGGSDFHGRGSHKDPGMGSYGISETLLDKFIKFK